MLYLLFTREAGRVADRGGWRVVLRGEFKVNVSGSDCYQTGSRPLSPSEIFTYAVQQTDRQTDRLLKTAAQTRMGERDGQGERRRQCGRDGGRERFKCLISSSLV